MLIHVSGADLSIRAVCPSDRFALGYLLLKFWALSLLGYFTKYIIFPLAIICGNRWATILLVGTCDGTCSRKII